MPFCAACGAPQIRVAGYSPEPEHIARDLTQDAPVSPVYHPGIQWSQALRPTAMAGLFGALLMFTPLGVFGLSMLMAGALSVYLYRRRNPWATLTTGSGAKLGIASGFFGSLMFGWGAAVLVLIFHAGGHVRAIIVQALDQSAARNPDPEVQQMVQYLKSPDGLATAGIFFAVFLVVFFVALAGAGGAIGAVMARRREGR
ncbi:MAG TPA: hypothetical protein VFA68_04615 [Terriglobales bacterium]|nr:hypothetical protein [Terriglobales bacterium]